jgi:hypothetical protein
MRGSISTASMWPASDDQHVGELLWFRPRDLPGVAVQHVGELVGQAGVSRLGAGARHHLLMADQVCGDEAIAGVVVDAIIRRPVVLLDHLPGFDFRSGREQRQGQADKQHDRPWHIPAREQRLVPQEIDQRRRHRQEPPERSELQPGQTREQHDAGHAAEDIDRVRLDAIGQPGQAAAQLLTWSHEGERDDGEEEARDRLDGDAHLGGICHVILGAKVNGLGRGLVADVDQFFQPAAGLINDHARGQGDAEQVRRPLQVIPGMAHSQAAQGHAEEAGQQDGVGEKG